jgi:hypothetical protein
MKRIGIVLLWIIELYLVVRAAVEPFVIDLGDPATYRHDWGGRACSACCPSTVGQAFSRPY